MKHRRDLEALMLEHDWQPSIDSRGFHTWTPEGMIYHRGQGESQETLALRYGRDGRLTSGGHYRPWREGDPPTDHFGHYFNQGVSYDVGHHDERLPRARPHERAIELITAPNLPGTRIIRK